jgi:hypothetical protein
MSFHASDLRMPVSLAQKFDRELIRPPSSVLTDMRRRPNDRASSCGDLPARALSNVP